MVEENLHILSLRFPYHTRGYSQFDLNASDLPKVKDQKPFLTEIDPNVAWLHQHNMSMKSSPYGLPLNSREYFTYFLVGIYYLSSTFKLNIMIS